MDARLVVEPRGTIRSMLEEGALRGPIGEVGVGVRWCLFVLFIRLGVLGGIASFCRRVVPGVWCREWSVLCLESASRINARDSVSKFGNESSRRAEKRGNSLSQVIEKQSPRVPYSRVTDSARDAQRCLMSFDTSAAVVDGTDFSWRSEHSA